MLLKSSCILSILVFSCLILFPNAADSTVPLPKTTPTTTINATTTKLSVPSSEAPSPTTPEPTETIVTTPESTTIKLTTVRATLGAVPPGEVHCKTPNCLDYDYLVDPDAEDGETTTSEAKITNLWIIVLIALLIQVRF